MRPPLLFVAPNPKITASMSTKASDKNLTSSSSSSSSSSFSSSTLNRSFHGNLPPSSSTSNPAASNSMHGNLLLLHSSTMAENPIPSSTLNPPLNPAPTTHTSLLPSSYSTTNPLPSTLGSLFSSSSPINPTASSRGTLLPSSSTTLYIDPVGPMPPSIPPGMRMMNFSDSRQETLLFEELFQDCRQKLPIDVAAAVDEEEEDNVTLELMPGGRPAKRPKIDLTLTIKPPSDGSPDSHA